jgi:uncharacterized membrane protein YccF (DUF307 family)
METDHTSPATFLVTTVVWVGTVTSWVTLSHLIGVATLVFTVLQIVIAIRKLRKDQS